MESSGFVIVIRFTLESRLEGLLDVKSVGCEFISMLESTSLTRRFSILFTFIDLELVASVKLQMRLSESLRLLRTYDQWMACTVEFAARVQQHQIMVTWHWDSTPYHC